MDLIALFESNFGDSSLFVELVLGSNG